MKIDKLRTYIIEFTLLVSLVLTMFIKVLRDRYVLSIILSIFTIFSIVFIKKKRRYSYRKKEILTIIGLLGFIYLLAFYAMGLYFGYYKNPYKFSISVLFKYIIPISIMIIDSEIMRDRLLSQKYKYTNLLTYLSMVLIDINIYSNLYDLFTLDGFLKLLGFVSFSSISCNLFYNYISNRYGMKGNILFRLLTILYMYILPIIPNVYIFFRSFSRIVYPFIMFLIIEFYVDKDRLVYKKNRLSLSFVIGVICLMIFLIGLISCNFRYGALVIGSESMTGTIDKGDAIVFEDIKDKSKIEVGDIIVFKYDDIRVVHRIVDKVYSHGEYHFYTQGDMNNTWDREYRTEKDVLGVYKFRIQCIGYPTLWINDAFTK